MDTKTYNVNLKGVFSTKDFDLKIDALKEGKVISRKKIPLGLDMSIILREEDSFKRSMLYTIYGDNRNYNNEDKSWTCVPERTKIDTVKLASNLTTLSGTFSGYDKVEEIDVSNWDTSNIVQMKSVFDSCKSLKTIDLSGWQTSKVKRFNGIFANCINLEHIEGVFDMTSCRMEAYLTPGDMFGDMFKNCSKLSGVKIKNPPPQFMGTVSTLVDDETGRHKVDMPGYEYAGLRRDQFEIVE